MNGFRLDLSTAPDWQPLEKLHALLRSAGSSYLDPDDFMFVGVTFASPCRRVCVYKHRARRSYLLLDPCGHAYRLADGELIVVPLADVVRSVGTLYQVADQSP